MRRRGVAETMAKAAMKRGLASILGYLGPRREVAAPRMMKAASLAGWALLAAGCTSSSVDQVTRPLVVGMTADVPPYYSDGEVTLYQVSIPAPLPVRKMTAADVRAVGAAPPGTPYPRGVFLQASEESVEVRFTISNVDDAAHDVWLLIDPWNEFVRWVPGVTVVSDEETIPNFGYDQIFTIPGKQRIEGTLTTDDMQEISIKLASVENLLASPQAQAQADAGADGGTGDTFDSTSIANNIMNPQNRSNSNDPLYTPWVPPVIAGVTGFDLGLRTGEPANVAVEVSMDVQDLRGNRFVAQDNTSAAQMGLPPATLSPVGARF